MTEITERSHLLRHNPPHRAGDGTAQHLWTLQARFHVGVPMKCKILLIGHDLDLLKRRAALLAGAGYQVTSTTPDWAFMKLRNEPNDVLLLCNTLSANDAHEYLLLAEKMGRNTPVVQIYSDSPHTAFRFACCADNLTELLSVVASALEYKKWSAA